MGLSEAVSLLGTAAGEGVDAGVGVTTACLAEASGGVALGFAVFCGETCSFKGAATSAGLTPGVGVTAGKLSFNTGIFSGGSLRVASGLARSLTASLPTSLLAWGLEATVSLDSFAGDKIASFSGIKESSTLTPGWGLLGDWTLGSAPSFTTGAGAAGASDAGLSASLASAASLVDTWTSLADFTETAPSFLGDLSH